MHPVLAAIVTAAFLVLSPPDRQASPALSANALRQLEVLSAVGQRRTPVERKLDTALHLRLLHQRGDQRLAPLTDFRFVTPDADGRLRVDVSLDGAGGLKPALDWLAAAGAPVEPPARRTGSSPRACGSTISIRWPPRPPCAASGVTWRA